MNSTSWEWMEEEEGNPSAGGSKRTAEKTDLQIRSINPGEREGERRAEELGFVHIEIDYWMWFSPACV